MMIRSTIPAATMAAEKVEVGEEDVISTLPTDLLILILGRLDDLRTLVRTTVLSTRWRHLAHQLSHLYLNADSCVRTGTCATTTQALTMTVAYTGVACSLLSCSSCAATAVKTLLLAFYLLDGPHLRSIGLLVDDVVDRGGARERLELGVRPGCPNKTMSIAQKTEFGQQFMSLSRAHPTTFRWLTGLTLGWIAFGDGSDVAALVGACERLRQLTLEWCLVVEFQSVVEMDAPRSQLELLVLINFCCAWVDIISLPNLRRLECRSSLVQDQEEIPQVSLGYVPQLRHVTIAACAMNWHTPFALSEWLPPHNQQLSILQLHFACQMIWIRPEHPKQLTATFRNLTDVYLYFIFVDCDSNWTLFFLEAAPSLQRFLIHRHSCPDKVFGEDMAERENVVWEEPCKDWKHLKLEVLLIPGFEEVDKVMDYLRLVMERAVGLRRIELREYKCDICDDPINLQPAHLSSPTRFPVDEASRLRVIQRLTHGFSSSPEIVIHH